MITIGLTGGFGSGKSTVSGILSELGARILDADKLGHELYLSGNAAWQEVVAAFGPQVLRPDQEVDRGKLAEIVFADPQALEKLNQIMHPRMFHRIGEILKEWRREGVKIAVLEAAVLFEANWTSLVDQVWVTRASEDTVVERVCWNKGFQPEQVRSRLRSQMPVDEKAQRAHAVIDTEGSLEEVRHQVEELWRRVNSA